MSKIIASAAKPAVPAPAATPSINEPIPFKSAVFASENYNINITHHVYMIIYIIESFTKSVNI